MLYETKKFQFRSNFYCLKIILNANVLYLAIEVYAIAYTSIHLYQPEYTSEKMKIDVGVYSMQRVVFCLRQKTTLKTLLRIIFSLCMCGTYR